MLACQGISIGQVPGRVDAIGPAAQLARNGHAALEVRNGCAHFAFFYEGFTQIVEYIHQALLVVVFFTNFERLEEILPGLSELVALQKYRADIVQPRALHVPVVGQRGPFHFFFEIYHSRVERFLLKIIEPDVGIRSCNTDGVFDLKHDRQRLFEVIYGFVGIFQFCIQQADIAQCHCFGALLFPRFTGFISLEIPFYGFFALVFVLVNGSDGELGGGDHIGLAGFSGIIQRNLGIQQGRIQVASKKYRPQQAGIVPKCRVGF